MKRIIFAIIVSVCVVAAGCAPAVKQDADSIQAEQTRQALMEANRQVGMPAIVNYQERKLAKMIFELRDKENFVCHAYLVNQMTGEVGQYLGKCLGYGLPYSVQFTSPEKIQLSVERWVNRAEYSAYYGPMPQADPNGLFMPQGLSATWLMLLDEEGKPHPVYVEPEIIVSPIPLHKE